MRTVERFSGDFRFLSNFWPAVVVYNGITFPTIEHAYQAAKSDSRAVQLTFLLDDTPFQAKRRGSRVKIRGDWVDAKVPIMRDLIHQKFSGEPLKSKLQSTRGMWLQEGNTWGDTFWGICDGMGLNTLGRLLMEERDGT